METYGLKSHENRCIYRYLATFREIVNVIVIDFAAKIQTVMLFFTSASTKEETEKHTDRLTMTGTHKVTHTNGIIILIIIL